MYEHWLRTKLSIINSWTKFVLDSFVSDTRVLVKRGRLFSTGYCTFEWWLMAIEPIKEASRAQMLERLNVWSVTFKYTLVFKYPYYFVIYSIFPFISLNSGSGVQIHLLLFHLGVLSFDLCDIESRDIRNHSVWKIKFSFSL